MSQNLNKISASETINEQIRVRGTVQGVGFRPTVYRIATQLGVNGCVQNDGDGVLISLQTKPELVDQMIIKLNEQCPTLARIDEIERYVSDEPFDFCDFTIHQTLNNEAHTSVVADASTCQECLNDINDKTNRRYHYAFTNCTHCGPRLSIIKKIPYDRQNTSMVKFKLCDLCQSEYVDPADRRFHAQPNACHTCGPKLKLVDSAGDIVGTNDAVSATAELIQKGFIVAIKGIGGFQLACDATNQESIERLRQRKNRPHKALALMARDVEQVSSYCDLSSNEIDSLKSTEAPIVILKIKHGEPLLPEQISPGQYSLGFMLPYSPLHHLLMQQLELPIVLTSGNKVEEPQNIDNEKAVGNLSQVADYFLTHDRDIINRVDDSVVRHVNDQKQIYRRARGYAPSPIMLPEGFDSKQQILSCGGELKNTFCLFKDNYAYLSQHMGNLENVLTFEDYLKNIQLYFNLFQFNPSAIAVDLHPQYLSTRHGQSLSSKTGSPLFSIQHHHAHTAACLVDNNWPLLQSEVISVVLDGLGLGDDGHIWGGEVLQADYAGYKRLACLKPVPMLGGTQSILEPWRSLYSQLVTHCNWNQINKEYKELEVIRFLNSKPTQVLNKMILSKLNSPLTSSCGRLFDAVAAATGICREGISYEGQAAIEFEAVIREKDLDRATPYQFDLETEELVEINPAPMWRQLLDDVKSGVSKSVISCRFHTGLAQALLYTVQKSQNHTGLSTVALTGGVFQNQTLFTLLKRMLEEAGFVVLTHSQVPTNDGGLALGQAAICSARIKAMNNEILNG